MGTSLPVILVHGWNSHPGIWNRLIPRLEADGIPYWRFDHSGMAGTPLPAVAAALGDYIGTVRKEAQWSGEVDIVCHSVGTCIARYLFEVMDGKSRQHRVRQLIGLGPPNNGSALAEIFSHPDYGPDLINRLTGVFVPRGFDPVADPLVQDVRPESPVMEALRTAGTRPDIQYRIIVTSNPAGIPSFFPHFSGETYEIAADGRVRMTTDGDGIVPNRESELPGVSLDIIAADDGTDGTIPPGQYCHIHLPRNPVAIDRILEYLLQFPLENK